MYCILFVGCVKHRQERVVDDCALFYLPGVLVDLKTDAVSVVAGGGERYDKRLGPCSGGCDQYVPQVSVGLCVQLVEYDCVAVEGVHQGIESTCDQGCLFPGDGDMDGDGVINLSDFFYWDGCATGPLTDILWNDCRALDLDGDRDVDAADFGQFQRVFLTHTR